MPPEQPSVTDTIKAPGETKRTHHGIARIDGLLAQTSKGGAEQSQANEQSNLTGDPGKAERGMTRIDSVLADNGQAGDEQLKSMEQAQATSDTSQAQKGIARIDQQLGQEATQAETELPLVNEASFPANDFRTQQEFKQIDQQLQGKEQPNEGGRQKEVTHIPPTDEVTFNELQPDTIYEKNDYRFETDGRGRTVLIGGYLQNEKGDRNLKLQGEAGKHGEQNDEGGHLIATRFNGPTDSFNLVPQNRNLNRSAWKKMENDWHNTLDNGGTVEVAISPVYMDNSVRPFGFDVLYCIKDHTGEHYETKTFYNESSKKE